MWDIARGVKRNSLWGLQFCTCGRTAVAGVTCRPVSSHRVDVGIHDVDVSRSVNRNSIGRIQFRADGRTTVSGVAPCAISSHYAQFRICWFPQVPRPEIFLFATETRIQSNSAPQFSAIFIRRTETKQ